MGVNRVQRKKPDWQLILALLGSAVVIGAMALPIILMIINMVTPPHQFTPPIQP